MRRELDWGGFGDRFYEIVSISLAGTGSSKVKLTSIESRKSRD